MDVRSDLLQRDLLAGMGMHKVFCLGYTTWLALLCGKEIAMARFGKLRCQHGQ